MYFNILLMLSVAGRLNGNGLISDETDEFFSGMVAVDLA
jgi:hypothetical protein